VDKGGNQERLMPVKLANNTEASVNRTAEAPHLVFLPIDEHLQNHLMLLLVSENEKTLILRYFTFLSFMRH
jgi:hypothetical protein